MRFHQIVGAPSIILTNEENHFVKNHHAEIPLNNLFDREQVIARTLVRKGIYDISKDNTRLILKNGTNAE